LEAVVKIYSIGSFLVAIVLTIALWQGFELDFLLSWIIAITLVTFAAFGYDKAMAKAGRARIPESVLLALTFAGGTVGALLGRYMFHHKTSKKGFRAKFWVVVLIQIAFIVVYYYLKFTQNS
jgi:uncharacterized membrane protein YsdA (DUF1294 family)